MRKTISDIGGDMPENLPPAEDIRSVRSGLKKARRQFERIDKTKALPKSSDADVPEADDDPTTASLRSSPP